MEKFIKRGMESLLNDHNQMLIQITDKLKVLFPNEIVDIVAGYIWFDNSPINPRAIDVIMDTRVYSATIHNDLRITWEYYYPDCWSTHICCKAEFFLKVSLFFDATSTEVYYINIDSLYSILINEHCHNLERCVEHSLAHEYLKKCNAYMTSESMISRIVQVIRAEILRCIENLE